MTRILAFVLSIFVVAASLGAVQGDLLQKNDVKRMMQEIFDQHVEKRSMTANVLKNAFKVYIDQFDPSRIYLLEEEVRPYLEINQSEMLRMLSQYQNNDLSKFDQLNDLIQKSIVRARGYRGDLEEDPGYLFHAEAKEVRSDWSDVKPPFVKDQLALKQRIKDNIINYIGAEKKRFGDSLILNNQKNILSIYDSYMRDHENQYLYVDSKGRPLPKEQEENLFVMHVLKAISKSLDSHTSVLSQTEAYDLKMRLEKGFQGIGVALKQTPEGIIVTKLIDGGPAQKSGLVKINDQIVSIDDVDVMGESITGLTNKLRRKPGTPISLILKRTVDGADKSFKVILKSELITIDEGRVQVEIEKFGNGIIGILKLDSFYQGQNGISADKDLRDAIRDLDRTGNLRGIVLDLRENSGGFLTQAIKVAGLFITNGVVVMSKYHNGDEKIYRDIDSRDIYDGPLVILTSKLTASAAEIVAQALQDYGVAVVVGDKHTYGKGTIQSQTITTGEGASFLKVTVGKYYTVSGNTPQKSGVKADILVPSQYFDTEIGEEYLEYAFKNDRVNPEYNDDLADIEERIKPWFLHYYSSSLQKKEDKWAKMVPVLKKNSEQRISDNKNYQLFLNGEKDSLDEDPDNYGVDDLQLNEAVNIAKDMSLLDTDQRKAVSK